MNLDIAKITSYGSDWETNRYTFLKTIKSWQKDIRHNKLYPAYEDSLILNQKLESLLLENIESKDWLEKEVRGAFIDDRLVVLEKAHQISSQLEKLIEFVQWGLEVNADLLNEAEVINSFVSENIDINPVCESNKYRGKGYFLIPDNKKQLYKIYVYELSVSWLVDEPIEYLETELLRSIPMELVKETPIDLMREFIEHSQNMYDPMIYVCETDLDFPFKETILPVAKIKLLEAINGLTSEI